MKRIGYTWNDEYRKQFYESPKVQAHLSDFIAQASLPKSPEQREKMSLASTGKAKTAAHRESMSNTQKFRQALKREIVNNHPELPVEEVWKLVRLEMNEPN